MGPGATQRAGVLERLLAERPKASGLASTTRLRTIDTAITALQAENRRWQIRPGQLLVIDEASLVGTFPLDTLVTQATAAGAKVLAVGDHAQLSAVDAGGAFNLLTERGRPAVLTSLWRFTHPWEFDRGDSGRPRGCSSPALVIAATERGFIGGGAA